MVITRYKFITVNERQSMTPARRIPGGRHSGINSIAAWGQFPKGRTLHYHRQLRADMLMVDRAQAFLKVE